MSETETGTETGTGPVAGVQPIMVEVTVDPSTKQLKATIPDATNIPAIAAAMSKTGGQAGGKSRRNKKSKGGKSKKSRKSRKSLRRK